MTSSRVNCSRSCRRLGFEHVLELGIRRSGPLLVRSRRVMCGFCDPGNDVDQLSQRCLFEKEVFERRISLDLDVCQIVFDASVDDDVQVHSDNLSASVDLMRRRATHVGFLITSQRLIIVSGGFLWSKERRNSPEGMRIVVLQNTRRNITPLLRTTQEGPRAATRLRV